MWDLIIRNAKVVDGSGKEAFEADIAVDQGRIVCIAPDITGVGNRTLDANGLVVCPGFIDIHTHSDFTLSDYPRAESRVHQGVTTEVVGNCGSTLGPVIKERFNEFASFVDSHGGIFKLPVGEKDWKWPSLADFYRDLALNGVAVNIAPLVGHGAIRCAVLGFEDRAPNPTEMAAMQRLLRVEMEQGLFGMSAGLIPGQFLLSLFWTQQ